MTGGPLAITTDQITGIGIGTIAVVVIVGVLVAVFISKLVVRLLVAVVVIALAAVIWVQRGSVLDAAQDAAHRCQASFFGIHIEPGNPTVRSACQDVTNR